MDLSKKRILITGASSGLGLATAKKFAELGAHIILLCRNDDKGRNVIKTIKQAVPDAKLSLYIVDLSSFDSVNNFVKQIKEKYQRLDILINNAAVMKQKRTLTKDGFETMFQVNFLSPVLLMTKLFPLLNQSNCGQIINITLPSSKLRLDFNDMQFEKNYKSFDAFFLTKLALLLYSLKISRLASFDKIKITSAVPNTKPFKSDLGREAPFFVKIVKNLISIPVDNVIENMVYIVEHGINNRETGKIFEGKKIINPTDYWKNEEIQKKVYTLANKCIEQK
jgi:NAD(P)-dependent dehydrogenase (short-subunit alcohol dehydrogenase family)